MKILFPGRFQPFHKGHLETFNELSKQGEVLIAVIRGSVTSLNHSKNPFSPSQQLDMIQACTETDPVVFANGYMPDILAWYSRAGIKIDAIACGPDRINTYAAQLERGGVEDVQILSIPRVASATEVRKALTNGDRERFVELMPPALHGWYKILKRTIEDPDDGSDQRG